ncbi:unnamed protein product [Caenorhabditis bovis]|uniref:Fibronectin type-III domain-containing protein n=1 Tax=Caenorhabditis bovis TaxID=2654633 RepID=A0A8S1F599_9PELO|nr:unnamed protein product [Caenorhabditis bovis]
MDPQGDQLLTENNIEDEKEVKEVPLVKWKKITSSNGPIPRPRHGHRAVAVKDLMLVFGGGNEGIVDELHIYNTVSNQWVVPTIRGDHPPSCAAFGLTAIGTRILVFGGMVEYGKYCNDLYDLQATRWEWRKLRPRGYNGNQFPCPRLGHTFTACPSTQKVYLFGGLANASEDPKRNVPIYLNDLFVLDVSVAPNSLQWDKPLTHGPGPSPRESHTAIVHETDSKRRLVIYGGMNGVRLGDLWFLDLESMTWTKLENTQETGIPPSPRSLHTAVAIRDKMYIFGGWEPFANKTSEEEQKADKEWKCSNTLGCFDLIANRWQQLHLTSYDEEQIARPRAGHCAAVIGSRMFVWSGRDGYRKAWSSQVCCRDMWVLETMKPEQPGRVQLIRASFNSLDISWSVVPTADAYFVQIAPYDTKNEQSDKQTGKIIRGQSVLRVVKQNPPGNSQTKQPAKAIIISKEDGVPQKVLYLSNDSVDGMGDSTKPSHQSGSLISTQGTTYTAPNTNQQHAMDEGGLPQNLFDEAGADESASPPKSETNEQTDAPTPSCSGEQEGQHGENVSSANEPTNEEDSKKNLQCEHEVKKEVEEIASESEAKEENSEQLNIKKEEEEQEQIELDWHDIGLLEKTSCTASHFFLHNRAPIEANLHEYVEKCNYPFASMELSEQNRAPLQSGSTYRFRVAAVNGLGRGTWSEVSTFKTCLPGFPSAPSSIKITKSVDGAQLTWEPPNNASVSGRISEYSVYLAVKNSTGGPDSQLAFMRVYVGTDAECVVPQSSLQTAYGYGPATQVRWLQDQKPMIPAPSRYSLPVSAAQPQSYQYQYQSTHAQHHQAPHPVHVSAAGHQRPFAATISQYNQQVPLVKRARME